MVKSNKLTILNASEKCEGIWTREEGKSKSVLDYMIINEESLGGFEKLKIDEDKEFAPSGIGKSGYSDHNVMVATFDWVVIEKEKTEQKRKIITTKGYAKIREELAENKVSEILSNAHDTQDGYDKWKRKVDEIKERNTTTVKRRNPRKKIKQLIKTKRRLKELAKLSTKVTKEGSGEEKVSGAGEEKRDQMKEELKSVMKTLAEQRKEMNIF